MAKSVRSKIKKRFRTLKRTYIEQIKGVKDKQDLSNRLLATINHFNYREPEIKNAFKHPKDPNAGFPQYKKQDLVDFRSSRIPFAGTEFSGAYRKKNKLQEAKELEENQEIEVENVEENIPENEEENIAENEEKVVKDEKLDLDFEKIKISKVKKVKKTEEEREIIYLKNKKVQQKKIQKKKQRSCKNSRKSMKF